MIWQSVFNILTALLRNVLQGKHQCMVLEKADGWGWHWECSCGDGGYLYSSEVKAIKSFSAHINREKVYG